MKTSIATLGLGVMLAAASASAQLPVVGGPTNIQATVEAINARFGSGTEYAATLAARDFLKFLYDVPAEQIGVQVIEAQGRAATVKATMPARECDLTLMKSADANKYGWVVQVHSCRGL